MTMSSQILDIRKYTFRPSDSLFLDANVWLSVYGPPGMVQSRRDRARVYSSAWNQIIKANCKVYLDVLVLSEFVNAFARFEYNALPKNQRPPDFKSFRRTKRFRAIAQAISTSVLQLSKHVVQIESGFESVVVSSLMNEFSTGMFDLNDQVFSRNCSRRGMTIVTDDSDFAYDGVSILTANPQLLAKTSVTSAAGV